MAGSSTDTHYIATGDDLPYVEATLKDGQGAAIPLAATDEVLFKMRRYQTDDPSIGGIGLVVAPGALANDPQRGLVRYVWQEGDTEEGLFEAQWKVTFTDGKIAHFPNYGYDVVRVSAIIPDPLPDVV